MSTNLTITLVHQQLPLKHIFRIARGAKTQADVVLLTISNGQHTGKAEAVPYARYKESIDTVTQQIRSFSTQVINLENINSLINLMPAGAARNALDCAWWDLQAKLSGTAVAELLNLAPALPCITAQTLSIDTPSAMASSVAKLNNPPLVKVKLDNQDIVLKMTAIAKAAPNSQFIVDANEAWTINDLVNCVTQLKALNVVLIEQPLPAGKDDVLIDFNSTIPLCADESCHTRADLAYLKERYQVINIKLDKTGGLSEAVLLSQAAKAQGFQIMLGCMVASSLAMAPAALLVNEAAFVDLDGPLLVNNDYAEGFKFENGVMYPLTSRLWGGGSE
ncbi:N-acetyl-D-Glu racemase DgcA [Pseudoalteromonas aliena]|uniref:N-acetyl-D-Glu racemase DgcA n=1 Tax=Pseudoalteromonas aliena TaxID=247523 RepID=UPI002493D410|nr:N-acetyl-D-Glu racemase DgcA [Pseudoalteromonas aliena]